MRQPGLLGISAASSSLDEQAIAKQIAKRFTARYYQSAACVALRRRWASVRAASARDPDVQAVRMPVCQAPKLEPHLR